MERYYISWSWHIIKIDNSSKAELYLPILEGNFINAFMSYKINEEKIYLAQGNHPKHTAVITKEWLAKQDFK